MNRVDGDIGNNKSGTVVSSCKEPKHTLDRQERTLANLSTGKLQYSFTVVV